MKRLVCLFGVLIGALPAWAGLELDKPVIEVNPTPEQETVEVEFTFRNTGDKAITVKDISSTCSCLSASLDSRTYAPGASGTGKAEFKISSFVGRHEKTVTVTTDDAANPEWVVPFVLDVPAVVEIEPRTLQWWIGDEPVAKETTVKMVGKDPLNITEVTATRDNVEFEVIEVKPGREYRIKVTPKETETVTLGALKVQTDSKIPKYQRQLAYFSVFRKPDSAK
ncbi:MAG: DUF1573 domain-containing protein [Verrucomicrobiales bacterium]|nr:DUF1573 domain-containing protein [Verrucomicrobiales bacterium]